MPQAISIIQVNVLLQAIAFTFTSYIDYTSKRTFYTSKRTSFFTFFFF